MSEEINAIRKYKKRMYLAWIIGIIGFIILFISVYNEQIKIWHFIVYAILLSIICSIYHYDSKSKFESYFNDENKFKSLILNNQSYFFSYVANSENLTHDDIFDFKIINDRFEGEYIDIKLGDIPKHEGIIESGEEVLELYFSIILYSHAVAVKIIAPSRGLLNFNRDFLYRSHSFEVGDVICSINTSQAKISDYLKEQEIIAEDYKKMEEEQIKSEIRERFLERERRKMLEKEVKEEMIDEGFISESIDNQKRESIPQEIQDRVWRRDGGKCVKCGSQEKLEFDHIIPVSKGGANTYRNIQLLCENCNRQKSNKIG